MDSNPGVSLFQGTSINVENALQNQEEEEDLEDQKRRQEEIHSLLTKQMDDFNYDDPSTACSSTNVSINDSAYNRKYREATLDDQLKVLYEVRVREVKSLTEQLDAVKEELRREQDSSGRKLMLCEAEKDMAQISLRQSQELLADGLEELNKLQNEVENNKISMKKTDEIVKKMQEELDAFRMTNSDLTEQLAMLKNGFGNDTATQQQVRENYETEMIKLRHNLEMTAMKLQRKDEEHEEFQRIIRRLAQEKDELMAEKGEVINKMGVNLEEAQEQCRELLKLVESVNQENHRLKINAANYELSTTLQTGLSDKTEIIKVLQKELDKANDLQNRHLVEYERLQQSYSELMGKNKQLIEDNKSHKEMLNLQHNELTNVISKNSLLEEKNKELLNKIISFEQIVNKVQDKEFNDHSVQVSKLMTSFCVQNDLTKDEIEKLELRLLEMSKEMDELKSQLPQKEAEIKALKILLPEKEAEIQALKVLLPRRDDEINALKTLLPQRDEEICMLRAELSEKDDELSTMQTKIFLEKERDEVIQKLQEKAAEFEKIITEKASTNEDLLALKAHYEAELIEREVKLRKEFEEKRSSPDEDKSTLIIRQLMSKVAELSEKECDRCGVLEHRLNELSKHAVIIEKLKAQRVEDRETIIQILGEWKERYTNLEQSNEHLQSELLKAHVKCNDLETKLNIRESGDAQLTEQLKEETAKLLEQWNVQAIDGLKAFTKKHHEKITESKANVDRISQEADKKVKEIERKYKKNKEVLQKTLFLPPVSTNTKNPITLSSTLKKI